MLCLTLNTDNTVGDSPRARPLGRFSIRTLKWSDAPPPAQIAIIRTLTMKRLRIVLPILEALLCIAFRSSASEPAPEWLWAKPLPEGVVATDRAGSVYLSGQFTGTLALGSTNLTAQGPADL